MRQDLHLLVLVQRERRVEPFDRGYHRFRQVSAGQRPVTDASLPRGKAIDRNGLELEDTAHCENARGERGDPILFGRDELRGVSIDLIAASHEIGERLWRGSFNGVIRLMHAIHSRKSRLKFGDEDHLTSGTPAS